MVAAVVVVLVAAGLVAADAAGAFRATTPTASGAGYKTGTATVKRRSLTSQTQVDAALGNAGSYTVVVPSAGRQARAASLAGAARRAGRRQGRSPGCRPSAR